MLLALMVEKKASDLFITAERVPTLKVTAIKLIISNFKSNAFSIAYGNLAKR